jgi:predicted TIM-barrel fold metal-dependent hydrolase
MIVDVHTHARRGNGMLSEFIAEMDRCGIDKAGVAAIEPESPESGGDSSSEYIYECVQQYPDRLFGWCSIVPYELNAPARLERYIREMGFKGLKLHPPIQGFAPSDPRIFPLIRKAIELDVPILIHTGPIYIQNARTRYGEPIEIDELALAFPEAKIIMAHGQPLGAHPAIVGKHPNVYMDTSIHFSTIVRFVPGLVESIIMRPTSGMTKVYEKVLLGSDAAPNFLERFRDNLEPVKGMTLPEDVKRGILGGNAVKLLKLDA